MSKLISVIIPNFNNAQWLPKCIDSCLAQQGNFTIEIIVVDDQSTDNSWEILTKYRTRFPDQISIYENPIKGGNNARNYGFSKSSGDYIQWLDSDDFILPGKLHHQITFFASNPDADIVYSDWRMDFYKADAIIEKEEQYEQNYDDFLIKLLNNEWLPPLSYLLRREIAVKLDHDKGWSPTTKIGQDREYFTMAAIIGANFKYVNGLFSVYNRWSKATVSNSMDDEKRSEEVVKLNNRFHGEIVKSELIREKKKYINNLNAELLRILFYNPGLSIGRRFYFWQLDPRRLHWKQRFFLPYLYLLHLIRK
ncbi:MAG: glycosyltransferase family A protein [Vicingaceae bacterium]